MAFSGEYDGSHVRCFGWAMNESWRECPVVWFAQVNGWRTKRLPILGKIQECRHHSSGWDRFWALPGSVVAWGGIDQTGHATGSIYFSNVPRDGDLIAFWPGNEHAPCSKSAMYHTARFWTWIGQDAAFAFFDSKIRNLTDWCRAALPGCEHFRVLPSRYMPE